MSNEKGKPINTSVPSIAIRFHANAEELEELYQSEDESSDKFTNEKPKSSDPESSPLRSYLRLGKRSTSIDNSLTSQDASPPSDPWKFFADIKGKITKSVEDTITEIKHRNQENDSSNKKKALKESTNLSDSEDISESSLSKTCGAMSTTEGVEMSSDDDTPSLEKDKLDDVVKQTSVTSSHSGLRQRIKSHRKKKPNHGYIKSLANLYELNTGIKPDLMNNNKLDDVESGIEAFEDGNLQESQSQSGNNPGHHEKRSDKSLMKVTKDDVVAEVVKEIDNLEVDENEGIKVIKVSGSEISQSIEQVHSRTYYSPDGFVDMRRQQSSRTLIQVIYSYKNIMALFALGLLYYFAPIPEYMNGLITGAGCTLIVTIAYDKIFNPIPYSGVPDYLQASRNIQFQEIPAIKEYQALAKYEGWMNEFPELYDPRIYHISQSQSVYVKLQGHLLKISHTRSKIPKRAMWNEQKHKVVFFKHRIYNLLGACVHLLPQGLNKKRHWSKKYPICITIDKNKIDVGTTSSQGTQEEERKFSKHKSSSTTAKRSFFSRKKKSTVADSPQVFSKLTEGEEELDLETASSSSPSPAEDQTPSEEKLIESEFADDVSEFLKIEEDDDDAVSLGDWSSFIPEESTSGITHIYLFGRTCREKEDWFRRLVEATHRGYVLEEDTPNGEEGEYQVLSETLVSAASLSDEYFKYMSRFIKAKSLECVDEVNVMWLNAFISRILFDSTRDKKVIDQVKERIQKKLSSIKLPYFIEQLLLTDLNLGNNSPTIQKVGKPVLDQRGLWIDFDLNYGGNVVLILQTKLNLMKLKQPGNNESHNVEKPIDPSAKWEDSEVEDTAESSTDEDVPFVPSTQVLDDIGNPVVGLGGPSNTTKKVIKMVDKIAESRFFQAASEYRYVKRAMEGVSNTDLRLLVEVKSLVGTLALNIPPPPSDRIWYGFRPMPQLILSAHPMVGERNMSFLKQLTNWIEKKLSIEFQKLLVIPNMEDIPVPLMTQKLPS